MSLAILIVAVLVLATVAWYRGGIPMVRAATEESGELLLSILPQLLAGFLLAGFVTVLLPTDAMSQVVGEGSGIPGLLVATAAGALTPGGPFLQFPLVATLAQAGAAPGPISAYLTAWSLLSVNRLLVWEIPVLGVPLAMSRWIVTLAVPVIVGLVVPTTLRFVFHRA